MFLMQLILHNKYYGYLQFIVNSTFTVVARLASLQYLGVRIDSENAYQFLLFGRWSNSVA